METRYYSLYTTRQSQYANLLTALADAWDDAEIVHLRIFFCGTRHAYLVIKSGAFDQDASPERLLTPQPYHITAQWLSKYPHPQRRWTGQWRTFTTAENLRHFANRL